jgi:Cu2+-exporting ATPase
MTSGLRCFHCGEPIFGSVRWTATVMGAEQPMCCAGCQAVAQAIVQAGAQGYYEQRTVEGVDPQAIERLAPWAQLLEDPAFQARQVQVLPSGSGPGLRQTQLAIEGLRCGACAWLIERVLMGLPGIVSAQANATTARLSLRWDPEQTSLRAASETLIRFGYAALPLGSEALEVSRRDAERRVGRRLFVAALAAAQVMMLATPEYVGFDDLEAETVLLLRLASLLITLPALLYSGSSFYQSAWRALSQGRLNMDVPIALGLSLAFLGSIAGLVLSFEHVYFDSVCMFLFLVLGARQIQFRVRRRTLARRESLSRDPPSLAYRVSPTSGTVAPWQLCVGDRIRVPSGERLPADATLISERAELDLSSLTGEQQPMTHAEGDHLPEGAINVGADLEAFVSSDPASGTLTRLSQLAEEAAAQRPQWALWADRIAAVFTALLLTLAGSLLAVSLWLGLPLEDWLPRLIAVLVVSCPCALSIAGPAAYSAALARLLEHGVAVSTPQAIESAWSLTDMVFDKTGTLSDPTHSEVRVDWLPSAQPKDPMAAIDPLLVWHLIAALTDLNRHPLSQALNRAAHRQIQMEPTNAPDALELLSRQTHSGLGIEGRLGDGRIARLGSGSFVQAPAHLQSNLFLALGTPASLHVVAAFDLEDSLRPEAQGLLNWLRGQRVEPHLFSGDRQSRVTRLGAILEIDAHRQHGDMSPERKQQGTSDLQRQGRRVAMVGDGVNDAPVLACADLSIAMFGAAPLAQQQADCYLLLPGLIGVQTLIDTAKRTRDILKQNLVWSVAYNLCAIPLAMAGYISPIWAAAGMSASSLLVMLNASRLLR